MSTKHQSPIYICDRCGTEEQSGRWPDRWGTYALPAVSKGPIMRGVYIPKHSMDLCDMCIKSLLGWVEQVKTEG